MALDWIKMRVDLLTSPKVVRMASGLKKDRLHIIGGLFSVWSIFDAQSEDGCLDGYTPEILDQMIFFPSFSEKMIEVGWLVVSDNSLSMPRFDSHNGKSAKKRAMDTERKRGSRTVLDLSDIEADKNTTREEKRREEDNKTLLSSSDDGKVKIDYQGIVDLYNKILPELPMVKTVTPKRRSAMKTCATTKPRYSGLDFWEAYFQAVRKSDFLMGRKKEFKSDFDFLVTHSKFVKIIEGGYQ